MAGFVALERRVANPLLPLQVVRDRNRGGAFVAIGTIGVAAFATFLYLTYYLQQTLAFSPLETGLAFLPMVAMVLASSTTSSTRLLPRVGPRPLVPTGLAVAAAGLVHLTGIEVGSSYLSAVLPGILLTGIGIGLVMAPSFATATRGVASGDAGVASAMVNTSQQIGGSLGIALLSTLFAGAVGDFVPAAGTRTALTRPRRRCTAPQSLFWLAAGILTVGAIVTALRFSASPGRDVTAPVRASSYR